MLNIFQWHQTFRFKITVLQLLWEEWQRKNIFSYPIGIHERLPAVYCVSWLQKRNEEIPSGLSPVRSWWASRGGQHLWASTSDARAQNIALVGIVRLRSGPLRSCLFSGRNKPTFFCLFLEDKYCTPPSLLSATWWTDSSSSSLSCTVGLKTGCNTLDKV